LNTLDNPVWEALNSADYRFNLGNSIAGYFPESVSPFAALPDWNDEMQHLLLEQLPEDRSWSVMKAGKVDFIDNWEIRFTTPLYQMICHSFIPFRSDKVIPVPLVPSHIPEMLALTALTKPGPFGDRTIEFGNYWGIFEEGKLVAMAGERLHLKDHTEISAVCTHPDALGKGYGSILVSLIAEKIIKEHKTPILHVRSDNERAITMYERLGFSIRSDIYFAVFSKKNSQ